MSYKSNHITEKIKELRLELLKLDSSDTDRRVQALVVTNLEQAELWAESL